jgi:Zn-dependent protease with chaperone function
VNPLVIPIALEWIFLVTTVAPMVLVGRFRTHPQLGLVIWFGAFLSAGVGAAIVLVALATSIFSTWLKIHESPDGGEPWLAALVAGFGPWLLLAVVGISMALINLKLEPLVAQARQLIPAGNLGATEITKYFGISVRLVALPIKLAYTDGRSIFVTEQLWQESSDFERSEILRHELVHIRKRHPLLKKIAGFIRLLSPQLAASKALEAEVLELTELIANRKP